MKQTKMASVAAETWATRWLDSVASGANTMSKRKVESIERLGGGLKLIRRLAKQRGVHLVRLTDDKGNKLVAASKSPFKVMC